MKETGPRKRTMRFFDPSGKVHYRAVIFYPPPRKAERLKIARSLGIPKGAVFFRCPAKSFRKVMKLNKAGDKTHYGNSSRHICEKCRCEQIAGYGTKHYGVGLCIYHETTWSGMMTTKRIAEGMKLAIQQGYPVEPYKYETENEFIDRIREAAKEAGSNVDLREELNLIRAHLQDFQNKFDEKDNKSLNMMTKTGPQDMTDEVRVDCITKLVKTVAGIARDQYVITESDYIHADEVKVWFYSIWLVVEKNIDALIKGEFDVNDLKERIRLALIEIPLPKTGKRK